MRRPARRMVAAVAGLVLASGLLASCSAARSDVGTSNESCYLALPTATRAVEGQGHLTGVRRYTLSALRSMAPRLYGRLADDVPPGHAVCVVAYTGQFDAAHVAKPLGRASGHVAVVVVAIPGQQLLGTLILTKVPVRFGHTHPF